MLNQKEKSYLLKLARDAIMYCLETGNVLKVAEKDISAISSKFREKKGCFVTLTVHSALRGCIGTLLPVQELYRDVVENAINAAFRDPRFPQVVKKEMEDISIEISVLDIPQKLRYDGADDLVKKLKAKPGVILKKGFRQATFLPQVWEDLPEVEQFLSHLCMKAGMNPVEWKKGELDIETYGVEKFSEKEE